MSGHILNALIGVSNSTSEVAALSGVDDQQVRSGLQTLAARYPADYASYRDLVLYGDGSEFSDAKLKGTFGEKSPFYDGKYRPKGPSLRQEVDDAHTTAINQLKIYAENRNKTTTDGLKNAEDAIEAIFDTPLSPFLGSKSSFRTLPSGTQQQMVNAAYSALWNAKYSGFNRQFPQTFGVREYDESGMSLSGVNRQLFGPGEQRGSSSGSIAEPPRPPRMR